MLIIRAPYYFYCSSLFLLLLLLIPHCYAMQSAAHIFRALRLPHSIKRLDVIGIVGDHVLLDSSSTPYYDAYGSVGSPFSLTPFDSLPPVPLPQTTPTSPFCLYPPSTTIPPPVGFGAGGGYNSPTPPPSSSINPPIEISPPPPLVFPIPPSTGGGYAPVFPSPPTSGGGYVPIITPSPPSTGGGGYVPITPSPPSTGGGGYVPITPSPPSTSDGGYVPITPSPPSTGDGGYVPITPSPPTTGGGGYVPIITPSPPTSGGGGYVPTTPSSPTVFQPPVVYPPPRGPPSPYKGPKSALWCVAKPAVPDPIIQEAMNYACGSGADCDSLQPNGSCFEPNTLLAHASYAFNSYWQRTKVAGGTCEFGGSAILVTVDPSYDGCHFMYNG